MSHRDLVWSFIALLRAFTQNVHLEVSSLYSENKFYVLQDLTPHSMTTIYDRISPSVFPSKQTIENSEHPHATSSPPNLSLQELSKNSQTIPLQPRININGHHRPQIIPLQSLPHPRQPQSTLIMIHSAIIKPFLPQLPPKRALPRSMRPKRFIPRCWFPSTMITYIPTPHTLAPNASKKKIACSERSQLTTPMMRFLPPSKPLTIAAILQRAGHPARKSPVQPPLARETLAMQTPSLRLTSA